MKRYIKSFIILFFILAVLILPNFVFANGFFTCQDNFSVIGEVEECGLLETTFIENRGLSLAFAMLAGLVDGSNVCALSLLLLFTGYLAMFVKDRKRSMKLGFVFLLTVFISYFVVGVVLSGTITALLHWQYFILIKNIFDWVLIGVLLVSGLLNFQDFFFSRKFIFDVNSFEKIFIIKHLKVIDVFTTIVVGVLSTIFLLPCSLPLYLLSVNVLVNTFDWAKSIGYIFIYDLFFILPLLISFAVILRLEKVVTDNDIHSGKFKWLKLIKGVIQILVAIGLYLILQNA